MSHTLTTFDDGHIILMTMNSDHNMKDEQLEVSLGIFNLLEAGPDRVVYIADARELRLKGAQDFLVALSTVSSPQTKQVRQHPKLLKTFAITNNTLYQKTTKTLNSASFGFFEVTLFGTVEEAIEKARALINSQDDSQGKSA